MRGAILILRLVNKGENKTGYDQYYGNTMSPAYHVCYSPNREHPTTSVYFGITRGNNHKTW